MASRAQLTELMKAGNLLNEDQVETYLGKGRNTLAIARSRGNPILPYIQVGRSIRYDPRDIAAFIDANRKRGQRKARRAENRKRTA